MMQDFPHPERLAQLHLACQRLPGSQSPQGHGLLQLLAWQGRPFELRQLADAWMPAQPGQDNIAFTFRDMTGVLAAMGWKLEILTRESFLQAMETLGTDWILLAADWETTAGFHGVRPHESRWFGMPASEPQTLPRRRLMLRVSAPREEAAPEALEEYVRRSVGLQWFAGSVQPLRPVLWKISALSALITLFALAAPLYVMLCYQQVIHPLRTESLPWLLAGALIWLAGEALTLRARRRLLAWASARLHHRVSLSAAERLLTLSAAASERANVMAQLLRQKSLETARDALCSTPFQLAMDAPFVLLLLGVMVWIGGKLALIPVVLACIYAALLFTLRTPLLAASHRHARALSERQQLVMEALHHLPRWRGLGLTERWLARFSTAARGAATATLRAQRLEMLLEAVSGALLHGSVIATLVLGIHMVWAGQIGTGALMASMMLCWRILTPLQQLCTLAPQIIQMRHSITQLNRLMDAPQAEPLTQPAKPRPAWHGTLRYHQVLMRYDRQTDAIFAGLSFQAQKGELVCITGGNGVGKSSVLKLGQGLYRPLAGSVRLDGADIRQFDARTLRTAIAYLPQNPQFISGMLGDALRLLHPMATEAEIWAALARAGADDWARKLPRALDHWLTIADFKALPSLLCHQLHLARLYLAPAPVLLIDELPNALLNSPAGQNFRQFLLEQKGKRTVLFASQREDYLRLADQLCWLRADGYPRTGRLKPEQTLALPNNAPVARPMPILHALH